MHCGQFNTSSNPNTEDYLQTADNIINFQFTSSEYSTLYNTLSFEYSSYEWYCSRVSQTFQNNKLPWLSLVLNWIIKMDNFCGANFPQKPKETMNRLHDENWRRSHGGRKCLQCFIALRLCLVSISSVLAGFKEKTG